MTTYSITNKETNETKEVTYEEALGYVLGWYKDNDMTRDMLAIGNRIFTPFSYINVTVDGLTAMSGVYNLLPDDVGYDANGMRV